MIPTSTAAPRGRRSAQASAANRERILAAALSCFARLGYRNTSNEDIAHKAGVSPSAIYNHFASKSVLYVCAFEQAEMAIGRIHAEAGIHDGNARAAIEAFFGRAEQLYNDDPDVARFLAQVSVEVFHNTELAMPLAEKVKSDVEHVLRNIITEGQYRGEIAAGVDADAMVQLHVNAQLGIAQVSLFYGADYYTGGMRNLKQSMLRLIFGGAPAS